MIWAAGSHTCQRYCNPGETSEKDELLRSQIFRNYPQGYLTLSTSELSDFHLSIFTEK